MRLDAPGMFHRFNAPVVGRHVEGVLRERSGLVDNLERAFVHPDGDLLARQAIFPKEPPVVDMRIPMSIQSAGKLGRIQDAGEDLIGIGPSQDAAQHLLWTVPPILACPMGEMMLVIVIGPPGTVCLLHLRPGPRLGKAVVGEPPLDRDYVELPLVALKKIRGIERQVHIMQVM